jgi:hypothetical protein
LNITVGGIPQLVKSSAEWNSSTITLLKGEVAWEVNIAGDIIQTCYMLRGDGFPVNGGVRDNYTRLRVRVDDFQIQPEGKPVASLVFYVNQIFAHLSALQNQIDTHEAQTAPHSASATPTPNRIAMFNSASGLKSDKTPADENDVIRKSEMDAEAAARVSKDNELQGNLEAAVISLEAADAGIRADLDASVTSLQQADAIEAQARAAADVLLRTELDTEVLARGVADSRLKKNIQTETNRARYVERAEVLMRIQSNLTLSTEFNSLYDLTMNTAADMIRLVDTETVSLGSSYERKLDKGYGSKVLRDTDHLDLFNANYVTEDEFNVIYDMVMETTGSNLLQVDVTSSMERKPNRSIDMELADGQDEVFRRLDDNPVFGDIDWVDL